jgi:hypothetical protein
MITYNIYCDESCHLPNDHEPIMVLGAVWCPLEKTREIAAKIRELKVKHHLARNFEIKWTKVSSAKLSFYQDIVDYFFDDDDLHFRTVVANKHGLDHERFSQNHDDWYYKMMFLTLQTILTPRNKHRIYIDIKDTKSQVKVNKLTEVLRNQHYDYDKSIIERVQQVDSHEIEQMQLADLLIGASGYANRTGQASKAKIALVERIRTRTGYSLQKATLLNENKFNLFFWKPQEENFG